MNKALKNYINYLIVACTVLFLFSCGADKKDYVAEITKGNNKNIRGIEVGVTPDIVKQKEGIAPSDEDSNDYLYYEFRFNENEYYTVSYSFDDKGLYETLIDVYIADMNEIPVLFEKFKKHFTGIYGAPKDDQQDMAAWDFSTEKSKQVEVSLSDESISYNSGKLSIRVYDFDY
jgi:hypothetical protein